MDQSAKDRLWSFIADNDIDVAGIELDRIIDRHSVQAPRSVYPTTSPLPDDANTRFWQTDWDAVLHEVVKITVDGY